MLIDAGSRKLKMLKPAWYQAIGKYAYSNLNKSLWQIIDTFVPYCVLWALMLYTVRQGYPYWVTLALALAPGGILVRVFILFHDCCHGSFFASRRANTILGYVSGILTFTPYEDWRYAHNIHHATQGDVDRQGVGDIWTMTKEEHLAAPRRKRLAYRIYRNPFVLFGRVRHCCFYFSSDFLAKAWERKSAAACFLPTWRSWPSSRWRVQRLVFNPVRVALEGSSYFKLPKILQWFSGNIGLHHVHHARPTIPNYNLQQCHDDIPAFHAVEPLTIRTSLKSLRLSLYDEEHKKLISFRALKSASR